MKPEIERRGQDRYRLGGAGAIAVWANNLGQIIDISSGGVSFAYMPSDAPERDGGVVDILDGGRQFFMEGVPCRVVVKKLVVNEVCFSMIRMVHCSLEFGALTPAQQAELASYIDTYARAMDAGV